MHLRTTLIPCLILFSGFDLIAQNITYGWPNTPCPVILSCDTGCSACDLPESGSSMFFGTEPAWNGVTMCPEHLIDVNNAVITYGWSPFVSSDHSVIVSGIAMIPMHLDSLVIRHRHGTDGPQRLSVSLKFNQGTTTVVSDVLTEDQWTNTVITDQGCVLPEGGQVYGFFSLILQPYQGQGGSWDLDDIRIVGSPCLSTGSAEMIPATLTPLSQSPTDLLGRQVQRNSEAHFFASPRGTVQLPF